MKEKLQSIINKAIKSRASDIHIEPQEKEVRVRFRIDGVLIEHEKLPIARRQAIVSSIKIMSDIDIAESRYPQDGRCDFFSDGKSYDLRCSTLPTISGEKIVIRILERSAKTMALEDIMLGNKDYEAYKKMIAKNSGLILLTGPTGSGKTTTLYSTLKELNSIDRNIITVEDPIEYQIAGINQVQVNAKAGLTFPKILRHILRQDPDIILIGEIRDLETARIAIQAALTGHLVFSTLHTRDAQSAVIRLVELGIEEYLVRDAVVGVVAQRLIKIIPQGRRAIFEIMHGVKPENGMRKLKDAAIELLEAKISTKEDVLRAIEL